MTYDHLMILGFLVDSEYLGVLSVSTRMAESLKTGDMVERHMRDGDIVLFNRQPHLGSVVAVARSWHGRWMPRVSGTLSRILL